MDTNASLVKQKDDQLLQTQKELRDFQSQIDELKKAHQNEIDAIRQNRISGRF